MADLPEGEIVRCGQACQSPHDFGTVLDSDLDYYAVCESFVAACPSSVRLRSCWTWSDAGGHGQRRLHVRGYGAPGP